MRKKKKDDKPTCAGCIFLDYYNDGEPFCIKDISHACISSGFAMREEQMDKEKTLRDEIAILALNGMLAHSTRYKHREGEGVNWHFSIAKEAYEIADAMLKVRNYTNVLED